MICNDMRDKVELVLDSIEHYHKCPADSCGYIWSHCAADLKTDEEHAKGHQCPQCQTRQVWKCNKSGAAL